MSCFDVFLNWCWCTCHFGASNTDAFTSEQVPASPAPRPCTLRSQCSMPLLLVSGPAGLGWPVQDYQGPEQSCDTSSCKLGWDGILPLAIMTLQPRLRIRHWISLFACTAHSRTTWDGSPHRSCGAGGGTVARPCKRECPSGHALDAQEHTCATRTSERLLQVFESEADMQPACRCDVSEHITHITRLLRALLSLGTHHNRYAHACLFELDFTCLIWHQTLTHTEQHRAGPCLNNTVNRTQASTSLARSEAEQRHLPKRPQSGMTPVHALPLPPLLHDTPRLPQLSNRHACSSAYLAPGGMVCVMGGLPFASPSSTYPTSWQSAHPPPAVDLCAALQPTIHPPPWCTVGLCL